jgi:hypothetical protein
MGRVPCKAVPDHPRGLCKAPLMRIKARAALLLFAVLVHSTRIYAGNSHHRSTAKLRESVSSAAAKPGHQRQKESEETEAWLRMAGNS